MTPLMLACRGGHLRTVQYLILIGANINHQEEIFNHTPLSLACVAGYIAVVKELLEHGANLHHKLKVSLHT